MRVLFIASRYLPHRGGLETVVREVSSEMRLAGHQVLIVTNRYPRALPAREMLDGIPIIRLSFLLPRLDYLRQGRMDLWIAGLVYFPITLVQLLTIMLQFRPQVVNLHYLGNPGLFVLILKSLFGFPLVVSLHGGDVDGEPYQSSFNRWLFRAVVDKADRVTACSRALLYQARDLVPEVARKAKVVHNGVDVELFMNARPFPHPRRYLLAVGQLQKHKGFGTLLSAFAGVQDRFPEIDLLLVGEGPERPILEEQIHRERLGGRVCLLGARTREQVASLMQGALAIVIPSFREAFGIVGVEAMASGKPIIASSTDGLREALEGARVIWCPPGEVGTLAACLSEVVGRLGQTPIVLRENQALARQASWSRIAGEFECLYQLASS